MDSQEIDSGQMKIFEDENIGRKLFKSRVIQTPLQLTKFKQQKLLSILKCTICSTIMINPVYLLCSHRFCKECLEKIIRKNEKKNCPNCIGQLLSKRELKIDFNLMGIIKNISGQTNELKVDTKSIELKQPEIISSQLRRSESSKIKQYKELKSEPRKRIKQNLQTKKITRSTRLRKSLEQNQKNESKNISQDIDMDQQASKEGKSDQNWQRHMLFTKKTRSKIQKQKIIKKQSSKQVIPSSLKNISSKNTPKQQASYSNNLQSVCSSLNYEQAISISDQEVKYKVTNKQLQQTQTFLEEQLGQNYLKQLLEIASDITCIDLSLLRFGNLLRTPQLSCSKFKMSLNTKIIDIKKYISGSLNITDGNQVKLIITNQQNEFETLDKQLENLDLYKINELYWKNYKQIKAFDMSDIINWLTDDKQKKDTTNLSNPLKQRILYYAIEYIF